nr:unnamed protein product [Digitaria exilis]
MGDQQHQLEEMSVDSNLELPPGFRFHPTDEEIITYYLKPKVLQRSFICTIIGEVNLNRTEPWELPGKAKMGDKEWYFFYQKDRKYPTGMRANRATEAGYWKATGKDKEIYTANIAIPTPVLVGMKKTLVFYKGRAPRGEKTNWVMHEFRLESADKITYPTSSSNSNATMKSSSASKVDEWVICRVFHKNMGIKKAPTSSSYNVSMIGGELHQSSIPMPMSMQFPILPDFTSEPATSYYSTAGANSSSVSPLMTPMVGMMNSSLFENLMAPAQPMPFHHQMGMGEICSPGFMATSESMPPLSMVAQNDVGLNPDQINNDEISSMVSTTPTFAETADMDGLWKKVLKK